MHRQSFSCLRDRSGRCGGQAITEYIVLVAFAVLVLITPMGNQPGALQQLVTALKGAYASISYAISLPSTP